MGSRNRFDKTRHVAPVKSSPTPTRSRADNRRSSTNPARPTGGGMGNLPTDLKSTEASAFASAARHRGQMADIRGGGGDTSTGRKPLPGTVITRDVAPPRASTVLQKGTQTGPTSTPIDMSRGFDAMIGDLGLSDYANFSSNQLPTTGANPFTATPSVTPGFGEEVPDIGGYNGATYDSKEGAEAAGSRDLSQFAPMTGKETRIEGASDRKKGGSLADALADTAGINSYMSKFSSGDRQRAADRAFLDAPDSMTGLRRKEAVNKVVYAGGHHYVPGESADSPALRIDRSDARDISNGKARAEQFKAKKVADTVAAIKQEPPTIEKPDVKQDFGRTETLSAPMNTNVGGSAEFNSNNDNPLPAFNNTGGLKTGFKRIDTSMNNPFG